MTLSLNEVAALAKKAARGVGYSWGLAEEAGMATRWLCAQGLDGCAELAGLLTECDGTKIGDMSPMLGEPWTAPSGTICPLVAGATLTDYAELLAISKLRLETVVRPMLLLPFAGLVAQGLDKDVTVIYGDTVACTDGNVVKCSGPQSVTRASVEVTLGTETLDGLASCTRANPTKAALKSLEHFAHRTYAPATKASRLKGAGAGLSDND